MSEDDKELTIRLSDQVKNKMESDPEIAAAMREFMANLHQAHQAVKDGRCDSIEDAMEAIFGSRPQVVETPDDPEDGDAGH